MDATAGDPTEPAVILTAGDSAGTFSLTVSARFSGPIDLLRRLFAASGALLVLLLTVASVSPALHDALHESTSGPSTESCAVELFASGISLSVGAITALPPTMAWHDIAPVVASEVLLSSPRYLRQPERGPPTLG